MSDKNNKLVNFPKICLHKNIYIYMIYGLIKNTGNIPTDV